MQVSPVMWWRSWAKKEFASSRSIGRIDSPRERILKTRRRHGRGEETVGYRVPWRGTKFEISSGGLPRAANFSFNSLPHKESRLPDPKGEKSRKRLESRCRAGQSSRNQLPREGGGFLRALRDHQFPHLDSSKSQGASTDFYTRWIVFIESYFSIGERFECL